MGDRIDLRGARLTQGSLLVSETQNKSQEFGDTHNNTVVSSLSSRDCRISTTISNLDVYAGRYLPEYNRIMITFYFFLLQLLCNIIAM